MKVRNPDATCANCPYGARHGGIGYTCLRYAPVQYPVADKLDAVEGSVVFPVVDAEWVCGEHPDFFKEVPRDRILLDHINDPTECRP